MNTPHSRTKMLIGQKAIDILATSKVAIFGVGGVGSYVAEGLARSGIGTLILIDNDIVNITNINRQLVALHSTIGKYKVDVMKERVLDINPHAIVDTHRCFFDEKSATAFDFDSYDYIVDAIDSVKSKILLIEMAKDKNIPIISSMGAGNKLDATRFEVSDIYKTTDCPLARVVRKALKIRNIKDLKVVYSKETPIKTIHDTISGEASTQSTTNNAKLIINNAQNSTQNIDNADNGIYNEDKDNNDTDRITNTARSKPTPGSVPFVPSVAGLIIAGEVVKDLIIN